MKAKHRLRVAAFAAEVQVSTPASTKTCLLHCHEFKKSKVWAAPLVAREWMKSAGTFIGLWLLIGAFVQCLLLEKYWGWSCLQDVLTKWSSALVQPSLKHVISLNSP